MKMSKLNTKKTNKTSKLNRISKLGIVKFSSSVKHDFRIIPIDDINKNRSSAYQYLVF